MAQARALAREGARLAINDLDAQRADDAAQTLAGEGFQAVAVPGDVSTPQGARRVVEAAAGAMAGSTYSSTTPAPVVRTSAIGSRTSAMKAGASSSTAI